MSAATVADPTAVGAVGGPDADRRVGSPSRINAPALELRGLVGSPGTELEFAL